MTFVPYRALTRELLHPSGEKDILFPCIREVIEQSSPKRWSNSVIDDSLICRLNAGDLWLEFRQAPEGTSLDIYKSKRPVGYYDPAARPVLRILGSQVEAWYTMALYKLI